MTILERKCKYCKEAINIDESELFYTIGKEPTRKDKIGGKSRQRMYFFHAYCFEVVGGKEYM